MRPSLSRARSLVPFINIDAKMSISPPQKDTRFAFKVPSACIKKENMTNTSPSLKLRSRAALLRFVAVGGWR